MSDQREWTHIPAPGKISVQRDSLRFPREMATILLDIIQDGVCILDRQMDLVYANLTMQYWYGNEGDSKCYARYHQLEQPCPNCPALKAFADGAPHTDLQIHESHGKVVGRQQLFCVPLFNAEGEAFMVMEYVRDVTDEKLAESSALLLEQQNILLKEHLERSAEENRQAQEEMTQRINYIVKAIKSSLAALLDERNYARIEAQIDRLINTVENRQSSLAAKLSDQERLVAKYIVEGYVSKEIADKLNLSKKTVDYHRTNIRKKMMLGPNDNLRQRLEEELY